MSYEEEFEDNSRRNDPFNLRQPVVVLEHTTEPRGEYWDRLHAKYKTLSHPALVYGYLQDKKEALELYLKLMYALDEEYGAGRRRHTISDIADLENAKAILQVKIMGMRGGFQRIQANSANLNQSTTHTVKDGNARQSLNPFKRG